MSDPPESPAPDGDSRSPDPRLARLSLGTRIILWAAGSVLVLIGVAGLVLPGIQGILTILAGIAVLSLASETAYRLLRRAFGGWPGLMERIDRLRQKVHDRLHRDR